MPWGRSRVSMLGLELGGMFFFFFPSGDCRVCEGFDVGRIAKGGMFAIRWCWMGVCPVCLVWMNTAKEGW